MDDNVNFDLGNLDFDISDIQNASFEINVSDLTYLANIDDIELPVNDKENKADLLAYIKRQQNENTARKTQNEAQKFINWLQQPPRLENRPPEKLPEAVLDNYVGQYLLTLKRKDGRSYQPDTLTSIHRAINRYLQYMGFERSLVKDSAFQISKKVLESKRKELKQQGLGNRDLKAEQLTPDEEDILWSTGELGTRGPRELQHTVWFLTTKLMGKSI